MKHLSVKDCRNIISVVQRILIIAFIGIAIAVVLSYLVHTDNIFSTIPGEAAEWFGFWASYLGVLASVAIALLTINKESEKLKEAVSRSIVGVNLRLIGVEIRPDISDKRVAYHMTFRFDNKANALFDDMKLENIIFKTSRKSLKIEHPDFQYKLQNNTPILDGEVIVEPFLIGERILTNFYFYYSQFLSGSQNLNIETDIKIEIDKGNVRRKKMLAELEILPEFDNKSYSNAIMVNHYELRPLEEETKMNEEDSEND